MADKEITIKVTTETDIGNMTDLSDILDDTGSKADDLGERLQTAFEEATAEVERLKSELEFAEEWGFINDVEELESQLEEAEQQVDELSDALSNLDSSGVSNAKDEAGGLSDNLSNANDNASELSNSMGLIDSAVLMDVANNVGAMGSSAENMAQEMNTAAISVGQLATNVGMAEPQMVSLIANISNATFPQQEAMAYVNALNQMGVSADRLGDSATNMDRINDATGIGYQKVMQLTQGLQAVGISADNLPASFNAIAYAQANVNGGADTLATVLKRQAATINEYGLNVDQLVLIMQKLSEQGVQGMKMGSELSKILKETNGDTTALEQSLGLTAGALSNAGAATGEYEGQLQNLADEESEHKTILDHLNSAWEDMQLYLSPILSPLASFVGLIGQFGQFALHINALVTLAQTLGILKTAQTGATAAQWSLNLSFLANPVFWLVAAIVALIAILVYLYFTNEDVRNTIDGLGQAFINLCQIAYGYIMQFVQWVIGALDNLKNYVLTLGGFLPEQTSITGNRIIDSILKVILFMWTLPVQLAVIFMNIIAKAAGFGDNFVQRMVTTAVNSVSRFMNQISSLPGRFIGELNKMLSYVGQWAATLPQKFWEAGVNAVRNFLNALDIHSPGIMQRKLIAEIEDTGARIPDASRLMLTNTRRMGEGVVDSFDKGFTGLNGDVGNAILVDGVVSSNNPNQGNGDIIINIYGDVDEEAKLQRFAEYIRRELNWNNATAGRTR